MGKVHDYIVNKINEEGKLHFTLIDPDRVQEISMLEEISLKMVESGTDAFLVGGSTGITPEEAGVVAKVLRKHGLPVIIFP
ncbi:MAG: geranylgeranylglyceryl/heptaprenylglyceryl phosphate synthase, partial [Desulfurococcaceae archaeon]